MGIYLDNASSTAIDPAVVREMNKYITNYGNPACDHAVGRQAYDLIEDARAKIAKKINAGPHEIIYTASGTEADNLALQGYAYANRRKGRHIIATQIEHASVLKPLKYLEHLGYDITYLPVDNKGLIDLDELEDNIYKDTILISVIFANNEIGTIQNIKEIAKIAGKYGCCLHTDAVQAIGYCKIDVDELGIDMMSISGHKIYAPKGIGALYVSERVKLDPLIFGAGQEFGLRAGTENTLGIVALCKAMEIIDYSTSNNLAMLKNRLKEGIAERIPDVTFNGPEDGLPNILSVSFRGVQSKALAAALSENGIYVSSEESCSSLRESRVLKAIGVKDDLLHSTIRFSFGKYNNADEITSVVNILAETVERLRKQQ